MFLITLLYSGGGGGGGGSTVAEGTKCGLVLVKTVARRVAVRRWRQIPQDHS